MRDYKIYIMISVFMCMLFCACNKTTRAVHQDTNATNLVEENNENKTQEKEIDSDKMLHEEERDDMEAELVENSENEVTKLICPDNISDIRKDVEYASPLHIEYYSSTTECYRGANVLLPSNYDENKEYPVLYFLHGIFGDEGTMINDENNRIPQIVKNLKMDGKIDDIIVVFPNMFATKDQSIQPGFTKEQTAPYDNFINDLVDDLMPYIEENYSVSKDRLKRGLIGFSMGGRETIYIGLNRSDLFAYLAAVSPAPGLVAAKDWAMEHEGQLSKEEVDIKNKDYMPELFLICCGTDDSVVGKYPSSYNDIMNENKVEHLWYEVPKADHDFNAIRSGLYNMLLRCSW